MITLEGFRGFFEKQIRVTEEDKYGMHISGVLASSTMTGMSIKEEQA